ncbi:MAG: bifunctional riboflavin kinase/FAD synthetase [Desulfovibrio sp.]|nr:bifunctional riboflavin kinase/FAD synthetase [Desulfovibrio sp.]
MRIATDPNRIPPQILARGCVVTIGNFDGVHLGHQALLRRALEKARAAALPSVVVTFSPHPLRVIRGEVAPPLLMALPRKLRCFDDLGFHLALVFPFTPQIAASSPEDFARNLFARTLQTKELVIGYDYAFGKGRRGDAALLARCGAQCGFSLEQLDPVFLDGDIVSSTRIRRALLAGDPAAAARLLGRPHAVDGEIIHGMDRGGKLLGFPTANLLLSDDLLLPRPGVYAVLAELPGTPSRLRGVANVGRNPTFGEGTLHVETHLLDMCRDLYSQHLTVHFIRHLREERKFSSLPELTAQINRDANAAREILATLALKE